MNDQVTFTCVLKSGKEYKEEHVDRLQKMIKNHYSLPYEFVALSDIEINCCKFVRLEKNWKTWWSKLELFSHDFGKTVYFDLDIDIVGSIDWLANVQTEDTIAGYRCPIYPNLLNSSIMTWRGPKPQILDGYSGKLNRFWKTWPHRWGDQGYIQKKMHNKIYFLPSEHIQRYRIEKNKKDASIIVYGGKDRPWNK
jgi:hypothetical protein